MKMNICVSFEIHGIVLQFVFTYALIICLVLAFISKFSGEMIFCTTGS